MALKESILEKEILILDSKAHSSDRKQYIVYLTCLGPGEIYSRFSMNV